MSPRMASRMALRALLAGQIGLLAFGTGCRKREPPKVEIFDEAATPAETEALGSLAPPWPAPERVVLANGLLVHWLHEADTPALHLRLILPTHALKPALQGAPALTAARALALELERMSPRLAVRVELQPGLDRLELAVHGVVGETDAVLAGFADALAVRAEPRPRPGASPAARRAAPARRRGPGRQRAGRDPPWQRRGARAHRRRRAASGSSDAAAARRLEGADRPAPGAAGGARAHAAERGRGHRRGHRSHRALAPAGQPARRQRGPLRAAGAAAAAPEAAAGEHRQAPEARPGRAAAPHRPARQRPPAARHRQGDPDRDRARAQPRPPGPAPPAGAVRRPPQHRRTLGGPHPAHPARRPRQGQAGDRPARRDRSAEGPRDRERKTR
jgi:hypothetical protein